MLTKADIEKYFIAEKQESLVFLVIGMAAIVLALIFYFAGKIAGLSGSSNSLLILGLIQAVAGYAVYVRSDDQRISQVYAYDMNPDQLKTIELTRMRKVKTNFLIYRWIEIGFLIAGTDSDHPFPESEREDFLDWIRYHTHPDGRRTFHCRFHRRKTRGQYTSQLEEFNKKA